MGQSKSPKMSKYFALLLLSLSALVGSHAAPREFSEDTEEEAVALEMPTYHFDPSQVSKFLRNAEIDVEEAKELFKRSNFDVDAANEFLKRSIEEVAEAGAVDIALGMAEQVSIIYERSTLNLV